MRCLIDTNIFLELLLNQEQAPLARDFLQKSDVHEQFMSDFSLHSIALILFRRKAFGLIEQFISDTVESGCVGVLRLTPGDLVEVATAAREYALDFDDAYQYVLAARHELSIVSFDAHFDKTPLGRQLPGTF